jgi:hypothetical protein
MPTTYTTPTKYTTTITDETKRARNTKLDKLLSMNAKISQHSQESMGTFYPVSFGEEIDETGSITVNSSNELVVKKPTAVAQSYIKFEYDDNNNVSGTSNSTDRKATEEIVLITGDHLKTPYSDTNKILTESDMPSDHISTGLVKSTASTTNKILTESEVKTTLSSTNKIITESNLLSGTNAPSGGVDGDLYFKYEA